ncbi:intermediate filament protein [Plakobranchus ocellatus]|uniref:Intermediate filament protein n=1 Tax=Plakobranchus ocellatus TaxID=259542 RepID=A0AAV3YBB1_9GAST|nr:intermediate filament protein [Plakobranchus ocellatus]
MARQTDRQAEERKTGRQIDKKKERESEGDKDKDRETINKLNQQLSELEGEIRMLRRTNDSLDAERLRDKQTIARLQDELEKLRVDLSNETIARLDAENKYQTLLEEIEFLKSVHEQELKELSALAYRDTTAENREFWKNELSQAIRDIQQEYDLKVDQIRGEMETFYNLKVQEFRTGATKQNMEVTHAREEVKKLQKMLSDSRGRLADLEARNAQLEKQYQDLLRELEQKEHDHLLETNSLKEEMNKLRAEMEGMLVELQTLMDAKLSLELEIAAYRKLLEHEESRIPLRSSLRRYNSASLTPGGSRLSQTGQSEAPSSPPVATSALASASRQATPQMSNTGSRSSLQTTDFAPDAAKVCLASSSLDNFGDDRGETVDDEMMMTETSASHAELPPGGQGTSGKVLEELRSEKGHLEKDDPDGLATEEPVTVAKGKGQAEYETDYPEVQNIQALDPKSDLSFVHDDKSKSLVSEKGKEANLGQTDEDDDEPADNAGKDVQPLEVTETMVAVTNLDVHTLPKTESSNSTAKVCDLTSLGNQQGMDFNKEKDADGTVDNVGTDYDNGKSCEPRDELSVDQSRETEDIEQEKLLRSEGDTIGKSENEKSSNAKLKSPQMSTEKEPQKEYTEKAKDESEYDVVPSSGKDISVDTINNNQSMDGTKNKAEDAKDITHRIEVSASQIKSDDVTYTDEEGKYEAGGEGKGKGSTDYDTDKQHILTQDRAAIEETYHNTIRDIVAQPSTKADDAILKPSDLADKSETREYSVTPETALLEQGETSLGEFSDDDSLCIQTMAEHNDDDEDIVNEDAGEALADSTQGGFLDKNHKVRDKESDGLGSHALKGIGANVSTIDSENTKGQAGSLKEPGLTFTEIHSNTRNPEEGGVDSSSLVSEAKHASVATTEAELKGIENVEMGEHLSAQSKLQPGAASATEESQEAVEDISHAVDVNEARDAKKIENEKDLQAEHSKNGETVPVELTVSQGDESRSDNSKSEIPISQRDDGITYDKESGETAKGVSQIDSSSGDVIISKTFAASASSAPYLSESTAGEDREADQEGAQVLIEGVDGVEVKAKQESEEAHSGDVDGGGVMTEQESAQVQSGGIGGGGVITVQESAQIQSEDVDGGVVMTEQESAQVQSGDVDGGVVTTEQKSTEVRSGSADVGRVTDEQESVEVRSGGADDVGVIAEQESAEVHSGGVDVSGVTAEQESVEVRSGSADVGGVTAEQESAEVRSGGADDVGVIAEQESAEVRSGEVRSGSADVGGVTGEQESVEVRSGSADVGGVTAEQESAEVRSGGADDVGVIAEQESAEVHSGGVDVSGVTAEQEGAEAHSGGVDAGGFTAEQEGAEVHSGGVDGGGFTAEQESAEIRDGGVDDDGVKPVSGGTANSDSRHEVEKQTISTVSSNGGGGGNELVIKIGTENVREPCDERGGDSIKDIIHSETHSALKVNSESELGKNEESDLKNDFQVDNNNLGQDNQSQIAKESLTQEKDLQLETQSKEMSCEPHSEDQAKHINNEFKAESQSERDIDLKLDDQLKQENSKTDSNSHLVRNDDKDPKANGVEKLQLAPVQSKGEIKENAPPTDGQANGLEDAERLSLKAEVAEMSSMVSQGQSLNKNVADTGGGVLTEVADHGDTSRSGADETQTTDQLTGAPKEAESATQSVSSSYEVRETSFSNVSHQHGGVGEAVEAGEVNENKGVDATKTNGSSIFTKTLVRTGDFPQFERHTFTGQRHDLSDLFQTGLSTDDIEGGIVTKMEQTISRNVSEQNVPGEPASHAEARESDMGRRYFQERFGLDSADGFDKPAKSEVVRMVSTMKSTMGSDGNEVIVTESKERTLDRESCPVDGSQAEKISSGFGSGDDRQQSVIHSLASSPGRFEAVRTKTVAETVSGEGATYVTTYQESHSARHSIHTDKLGGPDANEDIHVISFSREYPSAGGSTLRYDTGRSEVRPLSVSNISQTNIVSRKNPDEM